MSVGNLQPVTSRVSDLADPGPPPSSDYYYWEHFILNTLEPSDSEIADRNAARCSPFSAPGSNYYARFRAKIEELVEFSFAAAQLNNAPASIVVGVVKLPSVIWICCSTMDRYLPPFDISSA